jgi:hypothetical protein
MERKIDIFYHGYLFTVTSVGQGKYISGADLRKALGDVTQLTGELELAYGMDFESDTCKVTSDMFSVEQGDHFYVKNNWLEIDEGRFHTLESMVRQMMRTSKGDKPRKTAPSAWTKSIGYSTQQRNRSGYSTQAPWTSTLGISSSGLRDDSDKIMFSLVVSILKQKYATFADLFLRAGRIDIKYNTCITKACGHFDAHDTCHQVYFSLGNSAEKLMVEEFDSVTGIMGHYNLNAFDGRFQHWVEEYTPLSLKDRISVTCYLTDAPASYKHRKLTMAELKDHLGV